MYIKEINLNRHKIDENNIISKHVDTEKTKEVIVAERAEKRKKIMDFVNTLDNDELQILRSNLLDKMQAMQTFERQGSRNGNSPDCSCSDLAALFDCSIRDE